MERTVLTKEEIIEEIECAIRRMVKYHSEGSEQLFDIAQSRLEVLSSFAYTRSILNDDEYARYLSLQFVPFYRFKNPDEPTGERK